MQESGKCGRARAVILRASDGRGKEMGHVYGCDAEGLCSPEATMVIVFSGGIEGDTHRLPARDALSRFGD